MPKFSQQSKRRADLEQFYSEPRKLTREQIADNLPDPVIARERSELALKKRRDEAKGRKLSLAFLFFNVLLFLLKVIVARQSASVAVFADALNNMNDALTSAVSVYSLHLLKKPADKEHPYGHQRADYIAGSVLAIFVIFTAFELLRSGVDRLLRPQALTLSAWMLGVLIFSIVVKVGFFLSSKIMAKRLDSVIFKAIASDSLGDIFIGFVTLAALFFSGRTSLPLDAIAGLILALVLGWQGINILRETFDHLLGEPPSEPLVKGLKEIILASPIVISCHDLLIHQYGPETIFASVHIEIDSRLDLVPLHREVDRIEKKAFEEHGVSLLIHCDPVKLDDAKLNVLRRELETIAAELNPGLYLHDVQFTEGQGTDILDFELLLPHDFKDDRDDLRRAFAKKLAERGIRNTAVLITLDQGYVPYPPAEAIYLE